MQFTVTKDTPKGAPYQVGVAYKANGQPLDICPVCRGVLIGREIDRGVCGRDDRRVSS